MSITGSLVGYENNNEITVTKKSTNRSLLNITSTSGGSIVKPCPSLNSSISNSIITTASSSVSTHHHHHHHHSKASSLSRKNHHNKTQANHHQQSGQQNPPQSHLHLNSLWSIWYGVLVTLFQGYLAVHGAYRFLGCSLIQWKIEPVVELNIQIVLSGFVFVLLPLFFASAVFKVGNLANDGVKLASTGQGKCSASPHDGLEEEAKGGTIRALWTHGGPTAAFVHIVTALCLLLPRLLLEARIIENGLLPRENIWRNELDFLATNRDRLVVLSFVTSPYQNTSTGNETFNTFWDDEDDDEDDDELLEEDLMGRSYNRNKSNRNETRKRVIEHKMVYPKNPFYERTELIEKFRPDNEMMESHENLQIETNYGESLITSSTSTKPISSTSTTTARTAFTTGTTRTAKSIRNESRKNGSTGSNRSNKNRSSHKSHRHEERRQHLSTGNSKNPTTTAPFYTTVANTKPPPPVITSKKAVATPDVFTSTTISGLSQDDGTKSSNARDSEIHIVKPEKKAEIVPSTPISTNSKIFEIKKTKKLSKRMIQDEATQRINPEPLIGAVPGNMSQVPSVVRLEGFAGMLQKFFRVDKEIDVSSFSHPPSMEFLNLVLSLIVWSVRYPAVFWTTTKPFSAVFSVQMIANTIDIVLGYTGVSTLYKLQIVGQVLPIHSPALLLNAVVTISLFLLSTTLIIASSLVLYLYGHGRLAARIRDRCMITVKNSESWIYFAHCASLCLVLALAVVKAPIMHDLSATYRGSLDGAVLLSALSSVIHLFLWIVLWLGLTAKRRWTFKLPPLEQYGVTSGAAQPLLISTRDGHHGGVGHLPPDNTKGGISTTSSTDGVEDTIYWPKLTPSSPKLKVTFNEVTSTSEDILIIGEHDGKRNTARGTTLCITSVAGEADDGDYATLRGGPGGCGVGVGGGGSILHLSEYDELPPPPEQLLPTACAGGCVDLDNTSEEGKLLACVRDDSVTYASTRDLEPPHPPPPPPPSVTGMQSPMMPPPPPEADRLSGSPEQLVSPLAPVTVTVHTNEAHIASSSTPRCLRRADSGVPNEALTPRSDTTSTTESTTSPPERAPSETSSGVHSGEEREEVVIRPRPVCKAIPKPPQPVIQEEPFGRSTNMKMSSFNADGKSSATLPLTRNAPEQRIEYTHCSTMPLPLGCHQQYKPQVYTPTASKQQIMHTTLPNGVRYSNPHFLRRIPHVVKAESPYGHLGLGAGHHTFSKLLQDPLHSLAATSIPEDRDSANYSMTSEDRGDCLYANTQHFNQI